MSGQYSRSEQKVVNLNSLWRSINSECEIHFELNTAGVRQIFTSPAMKAYLQSVADEVANTASSMSRKKYEGNVKQLTNTTVAYVQPYDKAAQKDAMEKNTPLKALRWSGLPMEKPDPDSPGITAKIEEALNSPEIKEAIISKVKKGVEKELRKAERKAGYKMTR